MYLAELLNKALLATEETESANSIVLLPAGIVEGCQHNMVVSRDDCNSVYLKYRATEPDIEPIMGMLWDPEDINVLHQEFAKMPIILEHYEKLASQLLSDVEMTETVEQTNSVDCEKQTSVGDDLSLSDETVDCMEVTKSPEEENNVQPQSVEPPIEEVNTTDSETLDTGDIPPVEGVEEQGSIADLFFSNRAPADDFSTGDMSEKELDQYSLELDKLEQESEVDPVAELENRTVNMSFLSGEPSDKSEEQVPSTSENNDEVEQLAPPAKVSTSLEQEEQSTVEPASGDEESQEEHQEESQEEQTTIESAESSEVEESTSTAEDASETEQKSNQLEEVYPECYAFYVKLHGDLIEALSVTTEENILMCGKFNRNSFISALNSIAPRTYATYDMNIVEALEATARYACELKLAGHESYAVNLFRMFAVLIYEEDN